MSTKRVALIVSTLDGSGPGRVMATLAQKLAERGSECLLVATHGEIDSSVVAGARDSGVVVSALGMRTMWDAPAAAALHGRLRRWRPDVVHTRTIRADLLGRMAAAAGIPVINNIVNLYPEDCLVRLGPITGRAVMSLARRTKLATRFFVANARAVAENTRHAFAVSPERIRLVYDGLLLEEWRSAQPANLTPDGISSNEFVCLTVARLHPQKGIEDLVDAARFVVAQRSNARFVIAGDGPDRASLQERIDAAGLRRNVVMLGRRDDVPELMARADLFVLPSRFEGLPSAIIEAMAARRAVVATATAGVPELVEQQVTGWLVPPRAPDALACAIMDAMAADRIAMGNEGSRRAEERFSARAMVDGFEAIYEAACNG